MMLIHDYLLITSKAYLPQQKIIQSASFEYTWETTGYCNYNKVLFSMKPANDKHV